MIDSSIRTPVIIIVVKDNFFEDMSASYHQIKSRNATVVLMTNASGSELDYENLDYCIKLPNEGLMSSFYAVFIGQMIAYYLAITKVYNPDKPRQLSKELTTK
jgi:glucosamine--fructose-6-phosphate aminotransferase (isomerizing)